MSDPRKLSHKQRLELIRADRQLMQDIATEYGRAWQGIKFELDNLTAQIKKAQARGETVNRGWLVKGYRLATLEQRVRIEMQFTAEFATRRISAAQAEALIAGRTNAHELLIASLGPAPEGVFFTPALPQLATERIVGRSLTGKYLKPLLDSLVESAAVEVRRKLVIGVALGRNPRVIARDIRGALAGNQARALTIARTEVLSASRSAASEFYAANSDVVTGWEWSAEPNACEFCLGMDGSVHEPGDEMDTHPNCRCAEVPLTKSWDVILSA